jgi:N-methylhydantoinase A/oxoprolinase/acetone carboxylase beta subunit
MTASAVRVGIDVGGTFTHAVALDASGARLLAKARVPTTHRAPEGVARGIADALRKLLSEAHVLPERISFIAHSTTQATNALLEGDVACVGVVALGRGLEGAKTKVDTDLAVLDLPSGSVPVAHRYVDLGPARSDAWLDAARQAVADLGRAGAEVVVAAEAFSVDDPSGEIAVIEAAQAQGLLATGTHEVSGLLGLRARTRTSVLNASILPKMMAAARATEAAVRAEGITAPLMIVRSDGGVMTLDEVARRPVTTILSGPAAGVAAAVVHLGLADGVFVEVGGTSTDISAIVDGKPRERTATVGGHRLHLRTLDVETIAIAGGSMARVCGGKLSRVGPRSAHIAGLRYYCFSPEAAPDEARIVSPTEGDPVEYVVLARGSEQWAFTLTCARGTLDGECSDRGADVAGRLVGLSGAEFCRQVLAIAGREGAAAVSRVAESAELTGVRRRLVGGGGGCGSLMPSVAEALGCDWAECEHADVISAIGVARAILREVVERTVPNATDEALAAVRREAVEGVVRMGADPARVEVQVEVDGAAATVRAIATGPTELDARTAQGYIDLTDGQLVDAARRALGEAIRTTGRLDIAGRLGGLLVLTGEQRRDGLRGLLGGTASPVAVVDRAGRARLVRENARVVLSTVGSAADALRSLVDYGDHGARVPPTQLVADGRVVDLSGVSDPEQAAAVVAQELFGLPPEMPVAFIRSL